ncbi:MAG TPA: PDZ domain-containing protein [Kofleriaceae bacterium]|nr:PDZ domain-containing protein [Kofleriaceae bacterium]
MMSPEHQAQAGSGNQDQDASQDLDNDEAETFAWSTGQSHLGILVMGMTQELRRFYGAPPDRGVLIAKVEPGSAAERAGVQVGDVLVRVGRQRVGSGDDVIQALGAQNGGRVRLVVIRQNHPVRLDANLPRRQAPEPQGQQPL